MELHAIILETPRKEIPSEGLWLFVKELITRNMTTIEYFGVIFDNQADYIDEEMQQKINTTTFIEIHFESEDEIDYGSHGVDEVVNLILHHLEHSENKKIVADNKDITINFWRDQYK